MSEFGSGKSKVEGRKEVVGLKLELTPAEAEALKGTGHLEIDDAERGHMVIRITRPGGPLGLGHKGAHWKVSVKRAGTAGQAELKEHWDL